MASKGPPRCKKKEGHAAETDARSAKLHEEIKRVNAALAKCILEKRELEIQLGHLDEDPYA